MQHSSDSCEDVPHEVEIPDPGETVEDDTDRVRETAGQDEPEGPLVEHVKLTDECERAPSEREVDREMDFLEAFDPDRLEDDTNRNEAPLNDQKQMTAS